MSNARRDADIIEMGRQGVPYAELATLYGVSRQRVNEIALAAGVRRKGTRPGRRSRLPEPESIARMLRDEAGRLTAMADRIDRIVAGVSANREAQTHA